MQKSAPKTACKRCRMGQQLSKTAGPIYTRHPGRQTTRSPKCANVTDLTSRTLCSCRRRLERTPCSPHVVRSRERKRKLRIASCALAVAQGCVSTRKCQQPYEGRQTTEAESRHTYQMAKQIHHIKGAERLRDRNLCPIYQ